MRLHPFISIAKRTLLLAITGVFVFNIALSVRAMAISDEQKRIFNSHIPYFNVADDCGAEQPPASTLSRASNNKIYVIGDSLTVGMKDSGNLSAKLSNAGWKVTGIEATTGIAIDDSIPKIQNDKNDDVSSAGTIVVGLGTNKSSKPGEAVDSMLDAIEKINSTANVYWVNAYSTKTEYTSFNDILIRRETDKKLKVLDWSKEAQSHSGDYHLATDSLGIHTDAAGYIKRAKWLVDSLGSPPTSGSTSDPTTTNQSASTPDNSLSAEDKISGTFLVGFSTGTSKDTIESVVKKYKIAGIYILGTRDAAGSGFTKDFFSKLTAAAGHPLIIASDEEGESIQRYKYSFDFPNAGTLENKKAADVEEIGKKVGKALKDNGVTMDLGPVLDVAESSSNTVANTKDRAFSSDPDTVTDLGGAFAAGLSSSDITPVYKHFPGLGSTSGNSDTQSVTSPSLATLKKTDLKPYEKLANKNGAAIMLDNAHVPGLTDSGEVASTSKATVDLLRNDYNFKGLITTDDLGAAGVPGSLPEAISKSLKAGVDMPLFGYKDNASIDSAIASAKSAGVDTTNSLQKIYDLAGDNPVAATSTAAGAPVSCCPSSGGGSPAQLAGNTNAEKVWNFFADPSKNLSIVQIAAIMGNLEEESGFSPTAQYPGTHGTDPTVSVAWGLAQWTHGKAVTIKRDSGVQGDITDLAVQLNMMWWELTHRAPTGRQNIIAEYRKITTVPEAVVFFQIYYEGSDTQGRANRLAKAAIWKNHANGGAGSTAPDQSAAAETSASNCAETPQQHTGDANMDKTVTVSTPGKFITLPSKYSCPGHSTRIDSRVAADIAYLVNTYNLCANDGLASGHRSHGAGVAVDMIPRNGNSKEDWKNSAEAAAKAMGWWGDGVDDAKGSVKSCASYGAGDYGQCMHQVHPTKFPTWLRWMGYNGSTCHGDPWHIYGGCGAHIHIGWDTPNHDGVSAGEIAKPRESVYIFPAPVPDDLKNLAD